MERLATKAKLMSESVLNNQIHTVQLAATDTPGGGGKTAPENAEELGILGPGIPLGSLRC